MRAKDEGGRLLSPPHARLQQAPQLRQAGALALATDSRSAIWNSTRRLTVLNKVIDHVVDGDKIPSWVFKKDDDRPDNRCLVEVWRIAEKAVRAVYNPSLELAA